MRGKYRRERVFSSRHNNITAATAAESSRRHHRCSGGVHVERLQRCLLREDSQDVRARLCVDAQHPAGSTQYSHQLYHCSGMRCVKEKFPLVSSQVKDGDAISNKSMLYGYDALVWAIVATYALGGLTVAVVIKYADNILKVYFSTLRRTTGASPGLRHINGNCAGMYYKCIRFRLSPQPHVPRRCRACLRGGLHLRQVPASTTASSSQR